MKQRIAYWFAILVTPLMLMASPLAVAASGKPVLVRIETSVGKIDLELNSERAPVTVRNFLSYVDKGSYDGTIFHRVIRGFMIQGGGYDTNLGARAAGQPIQNEADNGLKNLAGTIAMARTGEPHSATNQFFINTVDNAFLDYREKTMRGWGYAVFGKVTKGMDVVRKIESTKTRRYGPFQDLPTPPVTIVRVTRIKP